MRAAARHGLRKVRQRYGSDDFTGAVALLAASETSTGLMRWEDYANQGVFGDGSYSRTGNSEVRPNTTSGPSDGDAVGIVDTGYCDGWLQAQILEGLAGYGGLMFRLTDGDNWWQFYTDADKAGPPAAPGGDLFLTKYVAGVGVGVWSLGSAYSVNYGDVLRVHLNGTTIECYLNSTLLHTEVDGFNNTATRHGIYGNAFVAGARVVGAGLGQFDFAPTTPAAPSVPAVVLQDQAYGSNLITPAVTQTVTLPADVDSTDTVVAVIYEYVADTAAVTSVTGLGGVWTQAARVTNADKMGMSVWVGRNLTAGATSVTAHSSANQTNEITLTRWSGLGGRVVSAASATNTGGIDFAADTGTAAVTVGRLVIGGVILNRNQAPSFTDSPAAWTDLGGSADFYPAYRIVTGSGGHSRVGVVSTIGWYCGLAVELG